MTCVGTNPFVRRQTANSQFSYFAGTWSELEALVEAHSCNAIPGYRDGVLRVPVPPQGFFSGVVQVTPETELAAKYEARRPGEQPFVQVVTLGGEKLPARAVEIILYRKDVLEADNDPTSGAEWDIISINARPTLEEEPMTPMAMARNMLGLPGGTPATYTAEQFAHAIIYWSSRAMRG